MLNITSNLRKILTLKRTSTFTMTLSASMKSSCPGLVYPRQRRRIATTATKRGERRLQPILVLRLYHRRRWARQCIITRVIARRITIRKQRFAHPGFMFISHFKDKIHHLTFEIELEEQNIDESVGSGRGASVISLFDFSLWNQQQSDRYWVHKRAFQPREALPP